MPTPDNFPVISRGPSSPIKLSAPCSEGYSTAWIMSVDSIGREKYELNQIGQFRASPMDRNDSVPWRSLWERSPYQG
ncbi:hypothetical protein MES4922_360001 [Mesorhizobium ventifaucium]|uniref:Uncharacterized protein n=1 Tax=Mesorhizobium ventifaucium TaxID=666020 RepID=A0ABM9E582_9HYPH|nr:hypothetical protein MES4922_360001 [Mesorhizobium ventifaucium]